MRTGRMLYAPNRGAIDLTKLDGLLYVAPWPDLYWNLWHDEGITEMALINWCLQYVVPDGKAFVDIGCNIGGWALNFATNSKISKVHTFEPNEELHDCVRMSAVLNQLEHKIEQHKVALGTPEQAAKGTVDLYVTFPARGESTIRTDVLKAKRIEPLANRSAERVTVPIRTLDSFGFYDVGFIKLDIEGAELYAIKGAVNTLEASGWPKMIFECWPETWWASAKAELLAFVDHIGYKTVEISGGWDMFLAERK
jgi:FkbM family methyltransferase